MPNIKKILTVFFSIYIFANANLHAEVVKKAVEAISLLSSNKKARRTLAEHEGLVKNLTTLISSTDATIQKFAISASKHIDAAISACFKSGFNSYINIPLIAVNKLDPLIMANPSLALSPGISIPALSIASLPDNNSPLKYASPSPSKTKAI